MGLFRVFKTGNRSRPHTPVKGSAAALAAVPVKPRAAPSALVRYSHAPKENDALPEERPVSLRGPKGRFTVTASGCGNEPEFNAFAYDDGKCSFYYYACTRPTKDAKTGILIHHMSQKRFSGPMKLAPKDEARIRANLSWLFKTRDFHAPQVKIKRAETPKKIDFIW